MSKHVLNYRPSPGLAILWTSFEPRLDLVGTSFESSVHAACGTIFILLPASLSSGYNRGLEEELCSLLCQPDFAKWCVVGRQMFPPIACPQNMCCLKYGLLQALMRCMILTHCKTGHWQISAPTARSLMKVGVPLGNWICYVFDAYIFWSNTNSKQCTLHRSKTDA